MIDGWHLALFTAAQPISSLKGDQYGEIRIVRIKQNTFVHPLGLRLWANSNTAQQSQFSNKKEKKSLKKNHLLFLSYFFFLFYRNYQKLFCFSKYILLFNKLQTVRSLVQEEQNWPRCVCKKCLTLSDVTDFTIAHQETIIVAVVCPLSCQIVGGKESGGPPIPP